MNSDWLSHIARSLTHLAASACLRKRMAAKVATEKVNHRTHSSSDNDTTFLRFLNAGNLEFSILWPARSDLAEAARLRRCPHPTDHPSCRWAFLFYPVPGYDKILIYPKLPLSVPLQVLRRKHNEGDPQFIEIRKYLRCKVSSQTSLRDDRLRMSPQRP